jgi:hypothetical protein
MLMKLIKVSCQFYQHFTQSFYTRRSQKYKNGSQVIGKFVLFGSTLKKSSFKHVDETDPSVNFINIKHTNFSYKRHFGSFYYVHVTRKKLPKQCSYEKFARLTLMKSTAGSFALKKKWVRSNLVEKQL